MPDMVAHFWHLCYISCQGDKSQYTATIQFVPVEVTTNGPILLSIALYAIGRQDVNEGSTFNLAMHTVHVDHGWRLDNGPMQRRVAAPKSTVVQCRVPHR